MKNKRLAKELTCSNCHARIKLPGMETSGDSNHDPIASIQMTLELLKQDFHDLRQEVESLKSQDSQNPQESEISPPEIPRLDFEIQSHWNQTKEPMSLKLLSQRHGKKSWAKNGGLLTKLSELSEPPNGPIYMFVTYSGGRHFLPREIYESLDYKIMDLFMAKGLSPKQLEFRKSQEAQRIQLAIERSKTKPPTEDELLAAEKEAAEMLGLPKNPKEKS